MARVGIGRAERRRPTAPGAYRVEVRAANAPGTPAVPWIVTQPDLLRAPGSAITGRRGRGVLGRRASRPPPRKWRRIRRRTASLTAADRRLRARLPPAAGRAGQSVRGASIPMPANAGASASRVRRRTSTTPMRVSVQLRFNDPAATRWARSVYLSPEARQIIVPFARARPRRRCQRAAASLHRRLHPLRRRSDQRPAGAVGDVRNPLPRSGQIAAARRDVGKFAEARADFSLLAVDRARALAH